MGSHYIFTFQPTFTQGLLLGQFSILILLILILKYLFLDSTKHRFETSSYQPRPENNLTLRNHKHEQQNVVDERHDRHPESTEWLNALLQQVVDVYRSKLRSDLPGAAGNEAARKLIEDYANRIRPASFLDYITIQSVDLGVSAPYLYNASPIHHESPNLTIQTKCDVAYTDSLSLSLSTSYLFNYPMSSFARLPVSLTVSLSQFSTSIIITPPTLTSPTPVLTISIPPDFTLDLTTTSLMGSRAKLANVPKLHELIQHQVRRIVAAHRTWSIVLPSISVGETENEARKEPDETSY